MVPASKKSPTAPPPPPATPMPGATLTGIVYDSLSDRPLVGADVVVSASAVTATTDSTGHYRLALDSVIDGPHTISFFHPSLDTLGIAAPPRTVFLRHDESSVADLAVPSAPTIVAAFCPDSLRTGGRGLILGDVRDAETDRPLPGALVVVMWSALAVGNVSVSRLPKALNVRADSDGLFRLCGVPPATGLRAQARINSKASGWLGLWLGESGVIVQQFLVGERPPTAGAAPALAAGAPGAAGSPSAAGATSTSAPAPAGSATLSGTVVGADGAPLEGAQVLLVGSTVAASARADYKGAFRLTPLPSGTQTVEVRLLSYQPKHYVVNLTPRKETHLTARLDQRAQVLDPVIVTARPTSDIPGFDERREHATGTFFTKQQIQDANSNAISDIFRKVPGMQVLFVSGIYKVVSSRGAANECNTVQWVVDGTKYSVGQDENMDELFRPTEIEAIEVYNSAVDTPPQFQGPQAACGTIVIWTNRGHLKKKAKPPSSNPP